MEILLFFYDRNCCQWRWPCGSLLSPVRRGATFACVCHHACSPRARFCPLELGRRGGEQGVPVPRDPCPSAPSHPELLGARGWWGVKKKTHTKPNKLPLFASVCRSPSPNAVLGALLVTVPRSGHGDGTVGTGVGRAALDGVFISPKTVVSHPLP